MVQLAALMYIDVCIVTGPGNETTCKCSSLKTSSFLPSASTRLAFTHSPLPCRVSLVMLVVMPPHCLTVRPSPSSNIRPVSCRAAAQLCRQDTLGLQAGVLMPSVVPALAFDGELIASEAMKALG